MDNRTKQILFISLINMRLIAFFKTSSFFQENDFSTALHQGNAIVL